jgi:dihydroxyacetone kinase-like protein
MPRELGTGEFTAMLRAAAETIRAHQTELSKLDSFGGDGDHGSTMARAMDHMESAATDAADKDLAGLLKDVGWAIMGVDGGATGPLLGTLFMSMAKVAGATVTDSAALAELFSAGLEGVRRRTKATPGDKTMLDALVPAVDRLKAAAESGASIEEALCEAADAAAAGAEATATMQARFGRAKNLGEKSIGEKDPGATSMSYLFAGFAEGATNHA